MREVQNFPTSPVGRVLRTSDRFVRGSQALAKHPFKKSFILIDNFLPVVIFPGKVLSSFSQFVYLLRRRDQLAQFLRQLMLLWAKGNPASSGSFVVGRRIEVENGIRGRHRFYERGMDTANFSREDK